MINVGVVLVLEQQSQLYRQLVSGLSIYRFKNRTDGNKIIAINGMLSLKNHSFLGVDKNGCVYY